MASHLISEMLAVGIWGLTFLIFNLSRFAGVSEAQPKREPAGEILTLSLPKGKDLVSNYPITNLPTYQVFQAGSTASITVI